VPTPASASARSGAKVMFRGSRGTRPKITPKGHLFQHRQAEGSITPLLRQSPAVWGSSCPLGTLASHRGQEGIGRAGDLERHRHETAAAGVAVYTVGCSRRAVPTPSVFAVADD
jgi:hypothetical protein